ncbi:MAG: heme ABC transporter ATP-binding protein [Halioglobus sp.]|nr:heme ABC transporter ATP-binding protein [Halioglobus sp.]
MSTLEVRNASVSPWGDTLLKDLCFTVEPGDVLALAGPNGAGKSTLLGMLSGDIAPSSGSVHFRTEALADLPARERATRLAVLPQLSLLNFPYTVEEVVLLGRIPHDTGRQANLRIVEKLLATFDLQHLRHRVYTQLSGGEKQRTQLARVFAQIEGEGDLEGSLLLLDEPTSALDLAHQQQVVEAIGALARRGCGVVLVIHDINLAVTVSARVLVMHDGIQLARGAHGQVLTPALFREVFGVEAAVSANPRTGTPLVLIQGATPC